MIRLNNFHTLTTNTGLLGNKLLLGGVTAIIAAVIGTAGVAAAQSMDTSSMPGNVSMCKTNYKEFNFKNKGDCVSWWAHHHGGNGYGGNEHHHKQHHHFHFHFHFHNYFADWWHHFHKHHK